MRRTPLGVGKVAVLVALSLPLFDPRPALAKPQFGSDVNDFCTRSGGNPAAPFTGDCSICHDPASPGRNQTPGFAAYKAGDLGYFCPANQPPKLDPIGDQQVDENGLLDLRIVASDPDGDSVQIEASDLPTGAVFQDDGFGTATLVWMPDFDSAGNYPVLFRATDTGNPPASVSEGIIITVGNANRPPLLEPVGNQSVAAGDRLSLVLRASDPDLDPVRFGAAGLPATATFLDLGTGSAELSWQTGSADVGNTTLTFTVTDAGVPMQSDSETVVVTVGGVNRPPELAPIGGQQAYPGVPLFLMIMASDPDGDGVSLAVDALPDGASFVDVGDGSARLVWTPRADQSGNHAITCTVSDDGVPSESASEAFTISVGDVNRPPVLDPPVVIEEGRVLVIPLTARDPDGDGLRFAASGLPTGASFVDHLDRTAEFRWEPDADVSGIIPLSFVVTDDGTPPESDSASTTITVQAAASAAPTTSWRSGWACGIGFELVFVLLPLMGVRRRRVSGPPGRAGAVPGRRGRRGPRASPPGQAPAGARSRSTRYPPAPAGRSSGR